MVNTNGIRIAKDIAFTERLSTYMPDFEIYLQFDSFKPEALQQMRGADLTSIRMIALEHLNRCNLSTTLVDTLQQGVNDDEIGMIIEFALKQRERCIPSRGQILSASPSSVSAEEAV